MTKLALYGDLAQGKRPPCNLRKRFKDNLNDSLEKVNVGRNTWAQRTPYSGAWRISVGVEEFENRVELKRADRYNGRCQSSV